MPLEDTYDATFVAKLSLQEKQIQQVYRPVIGIHKWFARRPGSVFRALLLAEFNARRPLLESYWSPHECQGVIADPFMGGGTPVFEANRLGFSVVGTDINPMAWWIVRQALVPVDVAEFRETASRIHARLDRQLGRFHRTTCDQCGDEVPVKYFLWVKRQPCPDCGEANDLFPGYRLAEDARHPAHVLVCASCGALNEYADVPRRATPEPCRACGAPVHLEGPARRNRVQCRGCGTPYRYPPRPAAAPPEHRLWAMEYHCPGCKPSHRGRFFKAPDTGDLARLEEAEAAFAAEREVLAIPDDVIPEGDETRRLHNWGYRRYREMFGRRQLLILGRLRSEIAAVEEPSIRHALLTVFSDHLRYQNMLGRYDTMALKCQDIFSVHGFPVGLVQCEANVLGIPRVGSGGFHHFVEKYARAKDYCANPYERRRERGRGVNVPTPGERIEARVGPALPACPRRHAALRTASAETMPLAPGSLDGVFTDPPYFDNVQYAELMDFCYAWLRPLLVDEFAEFAPPTTRCPEELTGNTTMGRGIEHFTEGLSRVFCHYAAALKPGAPFVFSYHHNDPVAYAPLVVAVLDAGLVCTAALPAAAEMSASLHIARTGSSMLDTIFVCRLGADVARPDQLDLHDDPRLGLPTVLAADLASMAEAGLRIREGDVRCLASGHLARLAGLQAEQHWDRTRPLADRMREAEAVLKAITDDVGLDPLVRACLRVVGNGSRGRRRADDCRADAAP